MIPELHVGWVLFAGAIGLIAIGVGGLLMSRDLFRVVLALAITEAGANLLLVLSGYRFDAIAPIVTNEVGGVMVDPVPQAMVLTAIVIGVGVQALALGLVLRIYRAYGSIDVAEVRRRMDDDIAAEAGLPLPSGREKTGGAFMNAIVLPVVLPLLAAFLLPSLARIWSSAARVLGPVLMLVSLCVLWTTWGEHPTPFVVALGGFQPPMGIAFHVDSVAMLFAFLVAGGALLMWPAWTDDDTMPRLAALTLLLVAAATGLALSGDLFNVYVFYELLSVASFGLVSARRTGAAFAAGFRYLVISGFGSVLALLGIALIYLRTGTLNIAHLGQLAPESLADPFGLAAFALLLLGFGVKAELFPVNTWVPEVYAGSSARVAGLLAGVVSKLAVLVVVRMLVVVFPHDETRMLLLILGVVGVLSGELAAWSAKDMRRMLAFSSIGQLGMIFIAFSIPGEAGWVAGLALVLHHLVVKSGLFLIADRWGGALQSLTGAARVSPFTAGLFVLFALSLIGVPPLPGFWAKLQLVIGLVENGNGVYLGALLVFLAATVIEANYLFRLAVAMYAEGASSTVTAPSGGNRIGAAIFAAVLVAAVFLLNPLSEAIDDLAVVGNDATGYMDSLAGGAR